MYACVYVGGVDAKVRQKRKKMGGNKKLNFTEGWIEFRDKKQAKVAALTLNNSPMDPGNKHGFYAEDLWNLKYLPKFKWDHLTERIGNMPSEEDLCGWREGGGTILLTAFVLS